MQGIFTHIPQTNYVPREYSVSAILLLLFMVLISLVSVLNLQYFIIIIIIIIITIVIKQTVNTPQFISFNTTYFYLQKISGTNT